MMKTRTELCHVDAVPGEREHRARAQAGKHGEAGGQFQVRREFAHKMIEFGMGEPARFGRPDMKHGHFRDRFEVVPFIATLTKNRPQQREVTIDVRRARSLLLEQFA